MFINFPCSLSYLYPLIVSWFIISSLYSAFCSLRTVDIKKLIAFTSIYHINVLSLGIISYFDSLISALALAIAHTINSGSLFFLAGHIYNFVRSRCLYFYSSLSFLWLFSWLANISFPLLTLSYQSYYL
jgi:NADH-ubiquinone oxidoreductase chain 4